MKLNELLKLSFHSLRANKMRSILTTLGIIIGVFAVILLVSIGSGLQAYITNEVSGFGSNLIFIVPGNINAGRGPGGVTTNRLTFNDAKMLTTRLESIADVSPVIQSSATTKYESKSDKFTTITGTGANYTKVTKTDLDKGAYFTPGQERSGSHVAVIGHTVANKLFGASDPIGKKLAISGTRYTVIGITAKKGSVFGMDQDNVAYIPVTTAQRQFGVTNISSIYISVHDSSLIPLAEKRAKTILLSRLTEDDFTLQTQEQALSTVASITNVLTIALGGIAAISLIVGGIGVMNIMLVSVTERTKEIGLRKALGARRADILKQFLLEAIMLSLTGGIIGILLGLGASYLVSLFFISVVTPWSVFLAFFFSVAVGLVFGMMPAIRASKLSPIEALRYE
jgi:putative ABC transport system permease protein